MCQSVELISPVTVNGISHVHYLLPCRDHSIAVPYFISKDNTQAVLLQERNVSSLDCVKLDGLGLSSAATRKLLSGALTCNGYASFSLLTFCARSDMNLSAKRHI